MLPCTTPDASTWWNSLDDDTQNKVFEVVRRVSRELASRCRWTDREQLRADLEGEAFAMILESDDSEIGLRHPIEQRKYGRLGGRLRRDLLNYIEAQRRRSVRDSSYDERSARLECDEIGMRELRKASQPLQHGNECNTYDRAQVVALAPLAIDPHHFWRGTMETAPDPDMPRTRRPAASSLPAAAADFKLAWERAPLSRIERQAFAYYYAAGAGAGRSDGGYTFTEVGRRLGVSRGTATACAERAVQTLVEVLNNLARYRPAAQHAGGFALEAAA